jgi:hypothetical protein
MAAVTTDLRYVLVFSILAMIAAVLPIAANGTCAPCVAASVVIFICHSESPLFDILPQQMVCGWLNIRPEIHIATITRV